MIDMNGNIVWTEAQIVKRTEAMIRTFYSVDDEAIINRKVTGQLLGSYALSQEEQAQIADYQAKCLAAQQAGAQARIDNALLSQAIVYEKAVQRLARVELSVGRAEVLAVESTYDDMGVELTPAVAYVAPIEPLPLQIEQNITDAEGNITGTEMVANPLIVADEQERSAAQAIVDAVTQDAVDLVGVRERV